MFRRLAGLTLAIALALSLTGCGSSPSGHDDRLVKAAGIKTLKLTCNKDVWERTGKVYKERYDYEIDAKVEKGPDDTVTVELSGPDLVSLLKALDSRFDTGALGPAEDPIAKRLYAALAPVVDSAKSQQAAGDPIPEVILDDAATGNTVPSPTTTPSP